MDFADLVRRASSGEIIAFVKLTRRFQHAAFGSALALVGDFQQAEDVVQEAFLAAWSTLPRRVVDTSAPRRREGISWLASDDCATTRFQAPAAKRFDDHHVGGSRRGTKRGAGG